MILTEVSAADLVQCDMKTSDMVTMAGIAAATSQSIIVGRNFEKNGFCKRCCAEGEITVGVQGLIDQKKNYLEGCHRSRNFYRSNSPWPRGDSHL